MTSTQTAEATFTCADCKQEKPVQQSGGTGYATDNAGATICYDCCAIRDRREMQDRGRMVLYLSHTDNGTGSPGWRGEAVPGSPWHVSNWPGTLKFNAYVRVGNHNMADKRYDAWFDGPDGHVWHGVTYGDNTQICHCRKTKEKSA